MPKVIAVFADGLGFHYTRNAFVEKLLKDVFQTVIPLKSILGFSCGIIPSIWTSNYPRAHGYWALWGLKKKYELRLLRLGI